MRTPQRWVYGLTLLVVSLIAIESSAATSVQSLQHYQLLQQALTRYRSLAAEPAFTPLPALPTRAIRSDQVYSGAEALRTLLVKLGDIEQTEKPPTDANTLDAELVAGLKRFQRRHQLPEDGVLGPATWRALTTPLSQRVGQIERTLARWDKLPDNPGPHAIFVNIPQFKLFALHAMNDREDNVLKIDVVVGKNVQRLRTPTFVADMTHVIFNPYWDVPNGIAKRELIPEIRKNAAYLEENNLEIISPAGQILGATAERLDAVVNGQLRLRQRPGSDNALGRIKFVLPNGHSVYLHDTPAQTLFQQKRRAFSHGCVRVADPVAMAEFVLRDDPSWTRDRIEQAMAGSAPLRVDLPTPIRVYIVYGTALALENGEVLFFDDIYKLDGR
jgi:L,D-transpeptidase YcbB